MATLQTDETGRHLDEIRQSATRLEAAAQTMRSISSVCEAVAGNCSSASVILGSCYRSMTGDSHDEYQRKYTAVRQAMRGRILGEYDYAEETRFSGRARWGESGRPSDAPEWMIGGQR